MISRLNHAVILTAVTTSLIAVVAVAIQLTLPGANAAASGTGRAAASGPAYLLSCDGHRLTRPHGTVVLACGDGNIMISDTHWSSWTDTSASGTTDLEINLCDPSCVQSKMRTFTGSTVRLVDAKRTSSGSVFSQAVITFTNAGKRTTVSAYPRT